MSAILKPFNWYKYDEQREEIVINEDSSRKSLFTIIFDSISILFWYVLFITFSFDIYFKYILKEDYFFRDVNLTYLNATIMNFVGAFRCILFTFYCILFGMFRFGMISECQIFERIDRYLVIFFWMLYCSYYLQFETNGKIEGSLFYLRSSIISAVIISATYIILDIWMYFLENSFVKKTLKSKIVEVSRTEKVLRKLKKYTYDLEDVSETSDPSCNINEFLCLDLDNFSSEKYEISKEENISIRNILEPEIFSLKDLLKLADDTFNKASFNLDKLVKQDFIAIFEDEKYALELFEEFDINQNQEIPKSMFEEILTYFFKKRALLSKALISTYNFMKTIKTMAYSATFILLIIISLIIFKIDLKEIFAFVVSFVIVINFIGNSLIKSFWKSIMFLISHQFDIGDEVIIENKEMTVYDIGLVSCSLLLANGGTIKISNDDLWSKSIINMTKAPEKVMLFTFNLPSEISHSQMSNIKQTISEFLKQRPFELLDTFVISSKNTNCTTITKLETALLLKLKNYTNRSKKFNIRATFTAYLKAYLIKNGIYIK